MADFLEELNGKPPGVHKATLVHARGLFAVVAFMDGLLLVAAATTKDVLVILTVILLIAFFAWRFLQMRLIFTPTALVHQGWFHRKEIAYNAIASVSRPHDKGWPHDKFYAPSVYEVLSSAARIRVNLLWFGPAGSREFNRKIRKTIQRELG